MGRFSRHRGHAHLRDEPQIQVSTYRRSLLAVQRRRNALITAGEINAVAELTNATIKFMSAADQLGRPRFDDVDLCRLRESLLREEIEELAAAELAGDDVEIIDALLDIIVVAYGTLVSYLGVPGALQWIFSPYYEDAGPASYWYITFDHDAIRKTDSNWRANTADDLAFMITYCANRLIEDYGKAITDAAASEVAKSNLAKIVDGRVIRREDGKVLKPEGWTPPDIAGVYNALMYPELQLEGQ